MLQSAALLQGSDTGTSNRAHSGINTSVSLSHRETARIFHVVPAASAPGGNSAVIPLNYSLPEEEGYAFGNLSQGAISILVCVCPTSVTRTEIKFHRLEVS
jgi:hypothetical protein